MSRSEHDVGDLREAGAYVRILRGVEAELFYPVEVSCAIVTGISVTIDPALALMVETPLIGERLR